MGQTPMIPDSLRHDSDAPWQHVSIIAIAARDRLSSVSVECTTADLQASCFMPHASCLMP